VTALKLLSMSVFNTVRAFCTFVTCVLTR